MGIVGRGTVLATLLAATLVAGVASADNNPNGLAFRAVGWFKGKGEISDTSIKCEIPTNSSAIFDGSFAMGLWNTYGFPTLYFPDVNGPFGNPCGGFLQLQNLLSTQAIQIDHIELRYKIAGAKRFRGSVPTRNQWPLACRGLQRATVYTGAVLNPINSTTDTSESGAPNIALIQVLPLVSTQMFNCLRGQYAPLPTDLYSSLPIVIRATVVGTSDSGDTYRSNSLAYTLNLRHTCGNGRLDDGEMCDPSTPFSSCFDTCTSNICGVSGAPCNTSADCVGQCIDGNSPSECVCVY